MICSRCIILLTVLAIPCSEMAPTNREQTPVDNQAILEGHPMLFSIIYNTELPDNNVLPWQRDSIVTSYTYSPSFWHDSATVVYRHLLGAIVGERFDKMYGPAFGHITELIREDRDNAETSNTHIGKQNNKQSTDAQDDETDIVEPIDVATLLQRIRELRVEFERLMKINNALTFIEERLHFIEKFLHQRTDNADKIMKEIEKFLTDIAKEIKEYIKELEKAIREFQKWLNGMEAVDLEDIFWKLHKLIETVEITDDGTIIIGDNEFELNDLVGKLCCPFG